MKTLLLTAALLTASVPAMAQVSFGLGPNGWGVQVGPPDRYEGRYRGWNGERYYGNDYRGDCRTVTVTRQTPRGTVQETRRVCD